MPCGFSPGTGRHQVQHCLYALRVQPSRAGHGQDHTGLRRLRLTRKWLVLRQHQMHARRAHAVQHADAARQFPLQRPRLVDLLLKIAGRHSVATVENLIADRTTRRQPILGQQQPRMRHLVARHQNAVARAGLLMRHMRAVQRIGDLPGLARVQVGIKQRHMRRPAAAQRQHGEHRQHRHAYRAQGHQPCRPQCLQPVKDRLHAPHTGAALVAEW